MQSVIEQQMKQCTIYIHICGDHPTNDSQGELQGEFYMQAKDYYLNRVYSDQMVLKIVRWGCWTA